MKIQAELLVNQFLRSYTEIFSLEEFTEFIKKCNVKTDMSECKAFLEESEYVFVLKNGRYATRAAAFTNQYFSFKPGRKEFDQGLFIAGDRCMPFVDPSALSFAIKFIYKGEQLPKKVGEFDSQYVLDAFSLYGDEYSSQYIASDVANADIDLGKTEFILPPLVHITGNSLEPLIADGFKPGDRLLCRVTDWDMLEVTVEFEHRKTTGLQMTMSDVDRGDWYGELEKNLLASFEVSGPLSSIEDQLAIVFANHRKLLCGRNCGSLAEFFQRTHKVGFELFGVETRLWFKGQDVPAIGKWNQSDTGSIPYDDLDEDEVSEDYEEDDCSSEAALEPVPQYVTDAYLKDCLFNESTDYKSVLKKLYPNIYKLTCFQQNFMLLHLKNRHDILSLNYNRFADSEIGEVRHKALALFEQVNALVYSIDMIKSDLSNYPQQSLVILSQIFSHVMHILEVSESDSASVIHEKKEILLSIEGMELNFECVSEDLKEVIARESKNGFSVIK